MNQMNIENTGVTDYSNPRHWLSLPVHPSKPIDVFYVYPTVWKKVNPAEPDYCSIYHASMLQGAALAFNHQATAFETAGNIYAPFYRQADGACTLPLTEDQRWEVLRKVPAADVMAAFDYYIRHCNNGRPYIIAGHSQGASVIMLLLSEYMATHPDVYSRMIAAYVIGYPVTDSLMRANPHLKFAQGPDDTGVIISYNTQSPKIKQGENPVVAFNIGKVINPISWSRDTAEVPASGSLGTLSQDSKTGQYVKVMNVADARIDLTQGVLICSSVKDSDMFRLSQIMPLGVYHNFDYPFYYFNIQENAIRRVNKFLGKK